MCSCRNNTKATTVQSYTVKAPDGSEKAYRSKTEARAALLRRPGSTVTPAIS